MFSTVRFKIIVQVSMSRVPTRGNQERLGKIFLALLDRKKQEYCQNMRTQEI